MYIKVLAGLLGEFGALMYIFVLALFVIMVVLSIRYGAIVKQVAGIRKRIRRSDDTPNQPVEHVEAEEIQQTDKNQQK